MDPNAVIRTIECAFDGVARPDTSLRQFRLTDLFGMSDDMPPRAWHIAGKASADRTWQKIPDAEIAECGCVLSHMDAMEFQYYLPAYMRFAIAHRGGEPASDLLGSAIFALSPSAEGDNMRAYSLSQFAQLDFSQQVAIRSFLKLVSKLTSDSSHRDAAKALETFWGHQDLPLDFRLILAR